MYQLVGCISIESAQLIDNNNNSIFIMFQIIIT